MFLKLFYHLWFLFKVDFCISCFRNRWSSFQNKTIFESEKQRYNIIVPIKVSRVCRYVLSLLVGSLKYTLTVPLMLSCFKQNTKIYDFIFCSKHMKNFVVKYMNYIVVISVCLSDRNDQEPLDRFALNLYRGTRETHGNVLSLFLRFKLSGSTFIAKIYFTGKIVQVRVNGWSNYEYPVQRWVP